MTYIASISTLYSDACITYATLSISYFLLSKNAPFSYQSARWKRVVFGLHVHVGVESGDKAVMICDRIMRHLPTLLALSVSSPFWEGRRTGLQSHRSKVMEGLPTAGLPTQMRNWSEYVWLVNHMIDTGFLPQTG